MIDNDLIWTMVDDAVPELLRALRQLLENVREEHGWLTDATETGGLFGISFN